MRGRFQLDHVWPWLGLVFLSLWGSPSANPAEPMGNRFEGALRSALSYGGSGTVGLLVYDLEGHTPLLSYRASQPFVPASNVKLFTTAAALEVLGEAYRFSTDVCVRERWDPTGVLRGNLYLRGGGDPSLTLADLARWASALREQGLRRVEGSVVGDGSLFRGDPHGQGWNPADFPWYYAAEASALSLGRNRVDLVITGAAQIGDRPRVRLRPGVAGYLTVRINAKTGRKSRIDISRPLTSRVISVDGTIRPEETVVQGMSVPDPALYTATMLTTKLEEAGIAVAKGPTTGVTPPSAVVLWEHRSAPLSRLIEFMNKRSDNHTAEQILRVLGARARGMGSPSAGAQTVMNVMERLSVPMYGCHIVDGSGLSRENRVTPSAIVSLLIRMNHHRSRLAFVRSLAVAGEDGTLRYRMKTIPRPGRVFAKTGTLHGVSALSGYLISRSGHALAFSYLANGHRVPARSVRRAQDRFCLHWIGALDGH